MSRTSQLRFHGSPGGTGAVFGGKLSLALCNTLLLFMFNVLGTNWGPTDRVQDISTKWNVRRIQWISYVKKHSLKRAPHAFGSELVKKSETEKA